MTLSDWHSLFQLLSVVLLFLTFAVGGGAVLIGNRINKEQARKLLSFEEQIMTAKASQEKLRQENLQLSIKLEEEQKERFKIEERVASRRIPERQRSELASRLKSFAGQTVSIWFKAGDHEGAMFASDIASTLKAAQWDVYAPASVMEFAEAGHRGPTTPFETGVVVVSTGHDASIRASDAVVHELLALGFDAHKSPTVENRPGPIVLVNVEARPEGPQGEAKLRRKKK